MSTASLSKHVAVAVIILLINLAATGARAESTKISVGGTGAGLGLMRVLAEAFQAGSTGGGVSITVLPSLGSGGGIRALSKGAIDLAITARPMKKKERSAALAETLIAVSPFVFVSSRRNPPEIRASDLVGYYAQMQPVWPDGKPLRVVLRPESDTDSSLLGRYFHGLAEAIATARKRSDLLVATTDQDNAKLSGSIEGSLSAMTLTQFLTEEWPLSRVPMSGAQPSEPNGEAGTSDFVKPLYLVYPVAANDTVKRFIAFIGSEHGNRLLREYGARRAPRNLVAGQQ